VDFVLQMAELSTLVRTKYIIFIAFSSTRYRPLPDGPFRPPSKKRIKALEKRRLELVARRATAMACSRRKVSAFSCRQPDPACFNSPV
jgi:hypothetical protein